MIGPWDLSDDRYFLLFAVICLTVVSVGVIRRPSGDDRSLPRGHPVE